MKKIVKEYHGSGYIYDDGDVPTCSFCGTTAETDIIHSGDYSGEHICEGEECTQSYMSQNIWINPFEVKEAEVNVCDRCDDVIEEDAEMHHPNDEDVCGYCVQDKEIE
tara:strand:+ start:342 stop:665 length:324 start_codon:yes stop_codon:yes gene_type:complete